jgi:arabinofuranosyltransferase
MVRNGLTRPPFGTGSVPGELKHRFSWSTVLALVSSVLLAAPVGVLALLGYQQRWVAEDAYISLRVADQILAGNGPVFNAGERVEAHTNPLWVGILSIAEVVGADTVLAAVFLGILLSCVGLFSAITGSLQLSERFSLPEERTSPALFLPAGAMVFVAVAVVWDFVTSGLETGLAFGWLGMSFWLLIRCGCTSPAMPDWQWSLSALVLGLGSLVRPDFAIYSLGFLAALAYLRFESHGRHIPLRDTLALMISAGIVPVGYQIFRMGYYAALVPNTALAKEAGESNWAQGRIYFADFVEPYLLWIPGALIAALYLLRLHSGARRRDWPGVVLLFVPVATAALHTLYIVRVGGDFMHGRMLLPAFFTVLLPVAAIRLPLSLNARAIAGSAAVVGLLVWSGFAGTTLRTGLGSDVDQDTGLVDERAFYVERAEHPNPVTLEDYQHGDLDWLRKGLDARNRVQTGSRVVVIRGNEYPIATHVPEEIRLVITGGNIGIMGYAAGPSVHVVDRLGLADPLGSRIELRERGRPGHEKALPMIWVVGRFTALGEAHVDDPNYPLVLEALQCGQIGELIEATTAPLTPERFLRNIRSSWLFHTVRIPIDVNEAHAMFCR